MEDLERILLRVGAVDAGAIARARARQRTQGASALTLGEVLVQSGAIDEGVLVRTIAQEAAVPIVQVGNFDVSAALLELVPADAAVLHGVLPLAVERGRGKKPRGVLHLAMVDPCDEKAVDLVREASGHDVRRVVALPSQIRAAIEELYAVSIDALDAGELELTLETPRAPALPPPLPPPPPPPLPPPGPGIDLSEPSEDTQPNLEAARLAPAVIAPDTSGASGAKPPPLPARTPVSPSGMDLYDGPEDTVRGKIPDLLAGEMAASAKAAAHDAPEDTVRGELPVFGPQPAVAAMTHAAPHASDALVRAHGDGADDELAIAVDLDPLSEPALTASPYDTSPDVLSPLASLGRGIEPSVPPGAGSLADDTMSEIPPASDGVASAPPPGRGRRAQITLTGLAAAPVPLAPAPAPMLPPDLPGGEFAPAHPQTGELFAPRRPEARAPAVAATAMSASASASSIATSVGTGTGGRSSWSELLGEVTPAEPAPPRRSSRPRHGAVLPSPVPPRATAQSTRPPAEARAQNDRPLGLSVPPPADEPPGKLAPEEARAALQLAILAQEAVRITLRGAARGEEPRIVEGTPVGFRASGDGRERVILRYSDEREQLVVLGRISDVAPLR